MKKYLLLFCLALLPMTMIAQFDCGDIDMICDKAMELANSGQRSKALEGLRNAKDLPELRKCSDIYKIDNAISKIKDMEQVSTSSNGNIITIRVGNVSFNMVRVDGGTFMMGATSEQGSDAWHDEMPTHSVTLSTYDIGETEVTQKLWQEVMGSNPSSFKGSRLPVEMVSWEDCQDFIRRLNQRTGKNFRLPTEAEWEYAARGGRKSFGAKYAGGSSVDDVAWYISNSGCKTHPVAQKRANELGLYDMSGNVREWCQDYYDTYPSSSQTNPTGPSSGEYRMLRGGGWDNQAGHCSVSRRFCNAPSRRFDNLGLRLASNNCEQKAVDNLFE